MEYKSCNCDPQPLWRDCLLIKREVSIFTEENQKIDSETNILNILLEDKGIYASWLLFL